MELATQTQAYTTKHDVLQIMMILRDKKINKKMNIAQVQRRITHKWIEIEQKKTQRQQQKAD